jgi:gluconolactonase
MLETLTYGYGLLEGPRVDDADNLYFSDVPNGGVYRRSPNGEVTTAIPKRKGVGGIALHADGGLVVGGRNICHVKDGVTRILFQSSDIPGFNDLFTDSAGRVYVGTLRSDPFKEGARTPGELWRIDSAGEATQMYGGVGLTNGIGFSPGEKMIYHADSAGPHLIVHDVAADGTMHNRRAIAQTSGGTIPDGICVDEAGCIWVAVYGGRCAARYTPEGRLDQKIDVPAKAVTSVCFGGKDRRDLYIVTADNTEDQSRKGTVFRTRVAVAGLPAPLARV